MKHSKVILSFLLLTCAVLLSQEIVAQVEKNPLPTNTFPDNGNVGIGTLSPTAKLEVVGTAKSDIGIFTDQVFIGYSPSGESNYTLSVDGKIRATEVKVYTGWADFVFEKEYDLPSLKEVEMYIKEYGHLQNIPSAKEVELNGIEVGEMNKLLLQKIEELTLYVITLNKEIESLKIEK